MHRLGAFTAAGIWAAFPERPIILSIFGFFFSMPCFYYIVAKPTYAVSARFVLLAYNLVCLYRSVSNPSYPGLMETTDVFCSYNIREENNNVSRLAMNRSASVTVGVVWAGIVSRFWWPTEARRELSRALGEWVSRIIIYLDIDVEYLRFCLNIGWLYTRLVAFNSTGDDADSFFDDGTLMHTPTPTESSTLLGRNRARMAPSIQRFMSMELHLQLQLIKLQGLLAQTQHEPRLKGPFPVGLYRSILTSLQSILDKLHSMRCVTSREEWHTVGFLRHLC